MLRELWTSQVAQAPVESHESGVFFYCQTEEVCISNLLMS